MISALRDYPLPKAFAALMLAFSLLVSMTAGMHAATSDSQPWVSIEAASLQSDETCQGKSVSHHVENEACPDGCCMGSCPVASLSADAAAGVPTSWDLRFDVACDSFSSHYSSGQLRPPMA